MKKILCIFLSVMLLCSLVACGGVPETNAPETDAPETDAPETAAPETAAHETGIRSEFKEALDSYEAFFVEYCSFMRKYMENPLDWSLLADYATYMTKYAEFMGKLDDIDEQDLSSEELAYYLEVNARISAMLADVVM